jgi:hypothetical protein
MKIAEYDYNRTNPQSWFVSSNERSRRLVLKLSTSGGGAIAFFDYAFIHNIIIYSFLSNEEIDL